MSYRKWKSEILSIFFSKSKYIMNKSYRAYILGSSKSSDTETMGNPYLLTKRFPKLQETTLPSPGFRIRNWTPSSIQEFSRNKRPLFFYFACSSDWNKHFMIESCEGQVQKLRNEISVKKKWKKTGRRNRTGGIRRPGFSLSCLVY